MGESEGLKMNLYKSRVSKLIELGFKENIGLDKESKFLKSVFSHKHIENGIRAMTIYNFSQEEFDMIYKSAKHMIEFGERLQKRVNNNKKKTLIMKQKIKALLTDLKTSRKILKKDKSIKKHDRKILTHQITCFEVALQQILLSELGNEENLNEKQKIKN